MPELDRAWWDETKVEAALAAVGRRTGLLRDSIEVTACSDPRIHFERRFDRATELLGLGSSVEEICFGDFLEVMGRGSPALLHVPEQGVLVIVGRRSRRIVLIDADGRERMVGAGALLLHLAARRRPGDLAEVEALLVAAGVGRRRRLAASQRMLVQRLGRQTLGTLWGLQLHGGASLWRRSYHAGVVGLLAALFAAYLLQHGLFVAAWGFIGLGALEGHVEPAWLMAWALLLLTQIPLRIAVAWTWGAMTTRTGAILKQRFMAGALRLHRREICTEGVGRLLGRVLEADALESAALVATFSVISAVVELGVALGVVLWSSAAWPNAVVLVGWVGATLVMGLGYLQAHRRWTTVRLEVTDQTVERMLGHETRLFQQPRSHWHDGEDEPLAAYLVASRDLDRARVRCECVVPRGWLVIGLLSSATMILGSDPVEPREIALVLGGVLLAYRALATTVDALIDMAPAISAWRQVRVVYEAGARRGGTAAADFAPGSLVEDSAEPVLAARGLVFTHQQGTPPVLTGSDLAIAERDRVVLCGRSGAGKSTLASLLTGLASPDAGTILCRGVDRMTTGDRAWRWKILGVCQFHENHVFNASLAFNLLMGRRWPPLERDWDDAKQVCRALGLGDVLDKMPAGIMQVVGQTGWQLSHGERSRMFVARALLQDPDVLLLDESFGALDPENARMCLEAIEQRSRALIVIAHL